MLTFVAAGPLAPLNDYAAGYYRPHRPGEFVPLVAGCPSELVATLECQRLAREAEERMRPVIQEHQFRLYARGAFLDDEGVQ